ncbi:MAG: Na/Pi cotransporter family protein [Rhodothermaceae bacterium]|nr:Na/Pi cotransporter family protein [Rhodothermaceae bacterium]
MDPTRALDAWPIMIGLAGGLALFLFGMEQMTAALKQVAGSGMKTLLARLTTNRFSAAFAGAFVTAVIQSSSVTTVLVVGFISAGLMTMGQSVGVIMGANVGTTITAQIVAFKVTQYALILVAVGFAALFVSKRERVRQYGTMLMGLGLIFFGMELMSDATRPLRSYEPFIALMQQMANPAFGILVGAAFTAVIQSSSATTGVVIVLATQGFITLEAGIALVFGANVGTCVTALLAAIGKPREAVRAAMIHVLFNVLGVVLWVGFIGYLADFVQAFSPSASGLAGVDRLAAETPRQIANAHTVFNIANTLLFLPFTTLLARLVTRLVPDQPEDADVVIQPRYLDELLLDTPTLALDRVRMELRRLGERAHTMVGEALPIALDGEVEDLKALERRDDEVDVLHGAIVTYLGRLAQKNLDRTQAEQHFDYLEAANNIENIADLIETNVVGAGLERLGAGMQVSAATREKLAALHTRVAEAVQLTFQALDAQDAGMAGQVIGAKGEIQQLADAAEAHLARRLTAEAPDRLSLYRFESELIEYLKRVYYFAKRIAKDTAERDLHFGPNGQPPVPELDGVVLESA